MAKTSAEDIWRGDLLGYRQIGETFTRLVQTIGDTKVISIEAGYGRGKTFFRERWAQHLQAQGEVVVQIDAHLSDHSGDPVLTFIGALIDNLPESDTPKRDAAFKQGKKVLGVLARTGGGILARQGAGALVDYLSGELAEELDGQEGLQEHVEAFGDALSKKAGTLIAAQIEAERVRTKELPEQMDALRQALTGNDDAEGKAKRIVVLVDELDRCHPDYAIAFLEAMKLVFNRKGFVFCLMVNADYLERIAAHRFGALSAGELYLEKFVDLRLKLPDTTKVRAVAARESAKSLPLQIPFGGDPAFSTEAAADLTQKIVELHDLSMRQIERVLLRVILALRCYADQPLDCPLLVWLAFGEKIRGRGDRTPFPAEFLPRASLTAEQGEKMLRGETVLTQKGEIVSVGTDYSTRAPELFQLPNDRYDLPNNSGFSPQEKVARFLAPTYLDRHIAILNSVRSLAVASSD